MSIFWKDKSKHPEKACFKEWFPVFLKENHRSYSQWSCSGVTEWESFKQIKTSLICVMLTEGKSYECEVDGKIVFISETDLRFPAKDCS